MPSHPRQKNKKKQAVLLILTGAFFIAVTAVWRFYNARILSFSGSVPQVVSHKGVRAVSISIPSVRVILDIKEAAIGKGVWQVAANDANHLNQSAYPGDGGNIVIYGHNKNSVFGPIRWLEKGAEIELTDEAGKKFTYKVTETAEVTPDNLQYILPKNEETLTLFTCTGFADSKRFVAIANKV